MNERIPSDVPALTAAILLAIVVPTVAVGAFNASLTTLAWGGAAWGAAVAVKCVVALSARRIAARPRDESGLYHLAIFHAALSSFTELGAAAICFAYVLPKLSVVDVLAFGIGAFSVEVLLVVPTYLLSWLRNREIAGHHARRERWIEGARRSVLVRWAVLVERLVGLLNHVGARALIYVAITLNFWPAALAAMAGFSVVEGLAAYGHLREWDWFSPSVLRRYYIIGLCVGATECMLYALLTQ